MDHDLNDLQSQRVDAAIAEYLDAIKIGEPPNHDSFLLKYMDVAAELKEFLDDHQLLDAAARRFDASASTDHPQTTNGRPVAGGAHYPLPRTFGNFELLEEIARGGMGVVFTAQQLNPSRTVALKMILSGQLASQDDVNRFAAEAHAAAALDHPHIVPIFEVGQHDGQHYFTMAFVEGQSLAQRLANGPLLPREAAEIIRDVALAVQFAHERGIIHRDLKPANILLDTAGRVRVTDFGLAKRTTDETGLTGTGQLLGTPSFMSPEQVTGDPEKIGPASDVYSLGATLYALVTGRPPFQAANTIDVLKQVLDKEIVPPRQLDVSIPRDLETLVLKCMEKGIEKRYESAAELAHDLDRFLTHRPILARRSTRAERAVRWCRRNPVVASLGLVVVALIMGTIAILSISNARIRAQAARSEQVAQFLADTLQGAGPSVALGRDTTLLREILDKTVARIETELREHPEVQGDLWSTLGNTYADIGEYDRAVGMSQHAVDSFQQAFGDQGSKLAIALGRLGQFQSFNRDVAQGNANARMALELARKCGDPHVVIQCLVSVASSFDEQGVTGSESEQLWREALALQRKLDDDPMRLAVCLRGLGGTVQDTDEGESCMREALAIYREHLGANHPKVASSTYGLGQSLLAGDKLPEAEAVLREAVELYRKVYDKGHPYQSHTRRYTVCAMARQHKWNEAEAFVQAERSIWTNSRVPGFRSEAFNLLVRLKACQGDWNGALDRSAQAIEKFPHPAEFVSVNRLVVLLRTGHRDEFHELCHAILSKCGYWKHRYVAAQAALLLPAEGEVFDSACQTADDAAPPPSLHYLWPLPELIKALAEYRRDRFDSAIEHTNRIITGPNPDKPSMSQAWFIQAMAAARLNRMAEANSTLAQGKELIDQPHIDFVDEYGGGWGAWTIADMLYHNAEAVVHSVQTADVRQPNS